MNERRNSENIWLVVNADRSFVCARIFDSKHQAEEEIKWDNALRGCIAIPATLNY